MRMETDRLILRRFEGSKGIHRICAEYDPQNSAPWRLLERLGFEREEHLKQNVFIFRDAQGKPIWKDTYIYGKLNE